jgi:outer membrane scaffolding protein for murein synthesis (MipA/OmpV family)
VAEHHSLGMTARMRLANRTALEESFAVPGVYQASGGLRDAALGANWHWEISNKYSLRTSLNYQRLLGGAAESPRVERPGNTSMVTVLTYRY